MIPVTANGNEFYDHLLKELLTRSSQFKTDDQRRNFISMAVDTMCAVQVLTLSVLGQVASFSADGFWEWVNKQRYGLPIWFPTGRLIECTTRSTT